MNAPHLTLVSDDAPAIDRSLIQALPKAELHLHLDGSLRPATLAELAAERSVALPVSDPAALGDWMRVDDARDLTDYLARFETTLAVMQDAAALERIAHELVIDAAEDGVRYLEVRFCPTLNVEGGLSTDEVMTAVWRGLRRGERETGSVARVIVCALRSFGASHGHEMAELAVAHRDAGVVGFDLAGGEAAHPARDYADAFRHARLGDLAVTVHAGEAAGADSVREAVHLCGADRIGHGTRLAEDASLLAYVRDRRLALELCPTSNVQTRAVPSLEAHPLRRYRDAGVVVTINTDNRLMSGISLTDEYARVAAAQGLGLASLAELSLAAFEHAFLPWPARQALHAGAAREIAQLLGDVPAAARDDAPAATGEQTDR